MVDPASEISFFGSNHARINIGIDVNFHETYDHQIWQAGTSRRVDPY